MKNEKIEKQDEKSRICFCLQPTFGFLTRFLGGRLTNWKISRVLGSLGGILREKGSLKYLSLSISLASFTLYF